MPAASSGSSTPISILFQIIGIDQAKAQLLSLAPEFQKIQQAATQATSSVTGTATGLKTVGQSGQQLPQISNGLNQINTSATSASSGVQKVGQAAQSAQSGLNQLNSGSTQLSNQLKTVGTSATQTINGIKEISPSATAAASSFGTLSTQGLNAGNVLKETTATVMQAVTSIKELGPAATIAGESLTRIQQSEMGANSAMMQSNTTINNAIAATGKYSSVAKMGADSNDLSAKSAEGLSGAHKGLVSNLLNTGKSFSGLALGGLMITNVMSDQEVVAGNLAMQHEKVAEATQKHDEAVRQFGEGSRQAMQAADALSKAIRGQQFEQREATAQTHNMIFMIGMMAVEILDKVVPALNNSTELIGKFRGAMASLSETSLGRAIGSISEAFGTLTGKTQLAKTAQIELTGAVANSAGALTAENANVMNNSKSMDALRTSQTATIATTTEQTGVTTANTAAITENTTVTEASGAAKTQSNAAITENSAMEAENTATTTANTLAITENTTVSEASMSSKSAVNAVITENTAMEAENTAAIEVNTTTMTANDAVRSETAATIDLTSRSMQGGTLAAQANTAAYEANAAASNVLVTGIKNVGTEATLTSRLMSLISLSNPFFIALTIGVGIVTAFATNMFGFRDAINAVGVALGNAIPGLKGFLEMLGGAGQFIVDKLGMGEKATKAYADNSKKDLTDVSKSYQELEANSGKSLDDLNKFLIANTAEIDKQKAKLAELQKQAAAPIAPTTQKEGPPKPPGLQKNPDAIMNTNLGDWYKEVLKNAELFDTATGKNVISQTALAGALTKAGTSGKYLSDTTKMVMASILDSANANDKLNASGITLTDTTGREVKSQTDLGAINNANAQAGTRQAIAQLEQKRTADILAAAHDILKAETDKLNTSTEMYNDILNSNTLMSEAQALGTAKATEAMKENEVTLLEDAASQAEYGKQLETSEGQVLAFGQGMLTQLTTLNKTKAAYLENQGSLFELNNELATGEIQVATFNKAYSEQELTLANNKVATIDLVGTTAALVDEYVRGESGLSQYNLAYREQMKVFAESATEGDKLLGTYNALNAGIVSHVATIEASIKGYMNQKIALAENQIAISEQQAKLVALGEALKSGYASNLAYLDGVNKTREAIYNSVTALSSEKAAIDQMGIALNSQLPQWVAYIKGQLDSQKAAQDYKVALFGAIGGLENLNAALQKQIGGIDQVNTGFIKGATDVAGWVKQINESNGAMEGHTKEVEYLAQQYKVTLPAGFNFTREQMDNWVKAALGDNEMLMKSFEDSAKAGKDMIQKIADGFKNGKVDMGKAAKELADETGLKFTGALKDAIKPELVADAIKKPMTAGLNLMADIGTVGPAADNMVHQYAGMIAENMKKAPELVEAGQSLVDILNSNERLTNPAKWLFDLKAGLDAYGQGLGPATTQTDSLNEAIKSVADPAKTTNASVTGLNTALNNYIKTGGTTAANTQSLAQAFKTLGINGDGAKAILEGMGVTGAQADKVLAALGVAATGSGEAAKGAAPGFTELYSTISNYEKVIQATDMVFMTGIPNIIKEGIPGIIAASNPYFAAVGTAAQAQLALVPPLFTTMITSINTAMTPLAANMATAFTNVTIEAVNTTTAIPPLFTQMNATINGIFQTLVNETGVLFTGITTIASTATSAIAPMFNSMESDINTGAYVNLKADSDAAFTQVVTDAQTHIPQINPIFDTMESNIQGQTYAKLQTDSQNAFSGVVNIVQINIPKIKPIFDTMEQGVNADFDALLQHAGQQLDALNSKVASVASTISSNFQKLTDYIDQRWDQMANTANSDFESIINMANSAADAVREIGSAIDALHDKTVTIHVQQTGTIPAGNTMAASGTPGPMIVNSPRQITVGESGPEIVEVVPLKSESDKHLSLAERFLKHADYGNRGSNDKRRMFYAEGTQTLDPDDPVVKTGDYQVYQVINQSHTNTQTSVGHGNTNEQTNTNNSNQYIVIKDGKVVSSSDSNITQTNTGNGGTTTTGSGGTTTTGGSATGNGEFTGYTGVSFYEPKYTPLHMNPDTYGDYGGWGSLNDVITRTGGTRITNPKGIYYQDQNMTPSGRFVGMGKDYTYAGTYDSNAPSTYTNDSGDLVNSGSAIDVAPHVPSPLPPPPVVTPPPPVNPPPPPPPGGGGGGTGNTNDFVDKILQMISKLMGDIFGRTVINLQNITQIDTRKVYEAQKSIFGLKNGSLLK